MSIRLNPDDLEVTTFAAASGGGEPLAPEAASFPHCASQTCTLCPVEYSEGCGTYVNNCTSPGYNC